MHFFSKKWLTSKKELVINYTSSNNEDVRFRVKEVIKMMEFLMTMAVIALVFIAATALVALISGGLLRLKEGSRRREAKEVSPE